jgi:hypothetical protein
MLLRVLAEQKTKEKWANVLNLVEAENEKAHEREWQREKRRVAENST